MTFDGPPGFRHSLLQRLPVDVLATMPASLAEQVALEPSLDGFTDLIFNEVAAIENLVDLIWRQRVSGPAENRPQLRVLANDLRLDASISIGRRDTVPVLDLSLGTVLAFDDIAMTTLSDDMVLAPSYASLAALQEGMEDGALVDRVGSEFRFAQRFADYSEVRNRSDFPRDLLTYAMPANLWRLLQVSLVTELMIAFVILHERVHFGLGHLDLVSDAVGDTLSLAEIGATLHSGEGDCALRTSLPAGGRRVLELQADSQAFLLLCAYALCEDGPCRRYETQFAHFGCVESDVVLRHISLSEGIRLSLTAASLACMAFAAALPETRGTDPTHPHPKVRLLSMVTKAPILSPLVQPDEEGNLILNTVNTVDEDGNEAPEFTGLIRDVFGLAMLDLHICASTVGEDFSPIEPGKGESAWDVAPWVEDLGCFWISDVESLNAGPATAGAKELLSLLDLQVEFAPRLAAFQRSRFGGEMSIDVGEITSTSP